MRITSLVKVFMVVCVAFAAANVIFMLVTEFDARSLILTTVVGGIVIAGFGCVLVKLQPINDLIRMIEEVKDGKMHININRSAIANDEIGVLTNSVYDLTEIIKGTLGDVDKAYEEYMKVGNMHYAIDSRKYKNSFKDVIERINNLMSQNTIDILSLVDVLNDINDGKFDTRLNEVDWMGDWVAIPRRLTRLQAA